MGYWYPVNLAELVPSCAAGDTRHRRPRCLGEPVPPDRNMVAMIEAAFLTALVACIGSVPRCLASLKARFAAGWYHIGTNSRYQS